MTPVLVLGIGVVGGLGAIARFALDGAVTARLGRSFPYGTFLVNLAGSFALGLMAGAAVSAATLRLAGVGFVGAFTTFSTWMLESHRLAEDGQRLPAIANFVVSLAVGLAAAALGRWAGGRL